MNLIRPSALSGPGRCTNWNGKLRRDRPDQSTVAGSTGVPLASLTSKLRVARYAGSFRTAGQTFTLLISRTDRFVVLDLIDTRPMMLSPEDPERFVASLTSRDDLHGERR